MRASSASTGACSNPTNPSTATTASTPNVPNPAEVRAAGDRVAKLELPAGRVGQPGDGLGEDDGDLGGQQHAEHPAGDVDPQQAQHGDDGPGAQRPRPPRRVHAQVGGGLAGRGRAERAVQPDLQEGVGQQRDQRGGHARGPAEAAGDERVERAGVA